MAIPAFEIADRSQATGMPSPEALEAIARAAFPDCLELAIPGSPLPELREIEVTLLGDEDMAAVHLEFTGITGPTDVLTFHHGEILIGAAEGLRHAADFGEPPHREIARYLVHGLLHLAGFEDKSPSDREQMIARQERILARLVADGVGGLG